MPDDLMQTAMQPYLKLVKANLGLLTTYSSTPEVMAQAAASAQSLLQQGHESAANLVQSKAFAQLAQGMLQNYTEFLTEVGQAGMEMLAQGQAAMLRQVQGASEQVVETSQTGKRGVQQIG